MRVNKQHTPPAELDAPDNPPGMDGTTRGYRADANLIQACLEGDEAAWKELVERYGRLVYSIPFHYGLTAPDADDVFQDVFMIVLRELGNLRRHTSFSAWLITITHRESVRRSKRTPNHEQLGDELLDESAPPLELMRRWEREHQVRLALTQLSPRCRELLTALMQDSPASYDKIAEQLGMPLGSIGPTRARCFEKLESILLEMGADLDF